MENYCKAGSSIAFLPVTRWSRQPLRWFNPIAVRWLSYSDLRSSCEMMRPRAHSLRPRAGIRAVIRLRLCVAVTIGIRSEPVLETIFGGNERADDRRRYKIFGDILRIATSWWRHHKLPAHDAEQALAVGIEYTGA